MQRRDRVSFRVPILFPRKREILRWILRGSANRGVRSSLTDPVETYSYSPWETQPGRNKNETSLGFSSERSSDAYTYVARQKPETADRSTARPDALFRVSSAVVITDGIAKPGERWASSSSLHRTLVRGGPGPYDRKYLETFERPANDIWRFKARGINKIGYERTWSD